MNGTDEKGRPVGTQGNKLVQLTPGGDWCDPASVRRVQCKKAHFVYKGEDPKFHVMIKFKDGDWTLEYDTMAEAVAVRDRVAALRNGGTAPGGAA